MTDYKNIHGFKIETVTDDPSNPPNGQVWYNSTSNKLKGYKVIASAWASGGNMNSARGQQGCAGTQTAGLGFGGYISTGPTNITESYNGSSWTEVSDLNESRRLSASGGTQTAALMVGGHAPPPTANTETWNGSNWTEVNNLNEGRRQLSGDGTNTSFLAFGGEPPQTTHGDLTESWNGSNWTEVADLNKRRSNSGAAGASNTSAICFAGIKFDPGGDPGRGGATNELWNGSNWTEVGDLNSPRYQTTGTGTATAALAISGSQDPPVVALCESWNGTAWTEVGDLSAGRSWIGSGGTNTVGLAFGGFDSGGTRTVSTEEFSGGSTATVEFDLS
jgi:hypothetical protein